MKSIKIVLSLFFLTSMSLKSQNSFEFIIQDTKATACYSTFVDYDGYFVSLGASGNINNYGFDAMLVRFTNPQDISINIFHKPDTLSQFYFGFLMSNGNYYIVGTIDDNSDLNMGNLYITEVSPEMNIVKENIYEIPANYNQLYLHNLYLDSDSIVILDGWVEDPAPGLTWDLYLAKLNMQGELLETKITTQFTADFHSEIVGKPDKTGYYLIGQFGYASLIEIDNDLNIVGYLPMDPDNNYKGAIGARWLSDEKLVIGSLANQDVPGAYYDLRMRVAGVDLVAFHDTVIFDQGTNWLPALSGLDLIDENNIWVATYPQLGKSTTDWEYGRIYVFDSVLNVKGAKYFGGASSLYLYSLKALDDGGCIITGIAADDQNKGYYDVYIKKVMPEDIITNAEETPDANDRDVLLFPLPFTNYLNIETYRTGLSLSLFSVRGSLCMTKVQLGVPRTTINASNLKKGFYYYVIYDNGKVIQSGKLIKN